MPSVADVYLTVHVSEREVKKEIERGVREGAAKADTSKAGEQAGSRFAQAFNKRSRKDLAGAGGAFGKLAGEVTGLGGAFTVGSRKANMFSRVLAGVGLATGLLESPTSALLGTTGALAGAMTAAGAGVAAYGIALKPVLSQVGALMKAQTAAANGTAAAKKKYQDLLKTTPPMLRSFTKELTSAQKAYKTWADSLAGATLAPLQTGLSQVHPLLKAIRPLVVTTANAFETLVTQLANKIEGGGVERVVAVLLPHVRPVLLDLGHIIGNVVGGLWGIIKAFLPFTDSVGGSLVKLTARFKDWASTLGTHSGFRALIKQWQDNWPLMREGLMHLVTILKNIVGDMAAMTTGGNSRALWLALNPLLRVAEALSTHPLLVQAFVYLLAIGKTSSRIKSVFDAMKTGWGTFSKIIGFLSGGKISLGMQSAGDTMLIAARQMQAAADTMVGAGAVPGAPAGKLGKAARGGRAGESVIERGLMGLGPLGFYGLFGGAAAASVVAAASPGGIHGPQQRGPHGETPPIGRAAALGLPTIPQQTQRMNAAGGAAGQAYAAGFNKGLASIPQIMAQTAQVIRKSGVAAAFTAQGQQAQAAARQLNTYTGSIRAYGLGAGQTKAARDALVYSLEQAGVKSSTAFRDVNRYTDAIRKNGIGSQQAQAARQQLVTDIANAFKNSQQGKRDMARYTDAIRVSGVKSDAAKGARQQLITDLRSSGLTSKEARRLVDKLTTSIQNIPTHHHTTVSASATARGKVIAAARAIGRSATDILAFSSNAAGWLVPGYGGGDRHPALLEGGETVVPKHLTPLVAPLMKANKVPGFAAGGLVTRMPGGSFAGATANLPKVSPWMDTEMQDAMRRQMVAAMKAEIRRWRESLFGSGGAAVREAMKWVGKVPYVWGGTALPGGADCSGFVTAVYQRALGITPPRTSEAQYAWVHRSGPQPGGLAFYTNPGGGPPPGHVAIVKDARTVISQGGPGLGPIVIGLHGPGPLMGTGVPPGGFGRGGGATGQWGETQLGSLWRRAGGPGPVAHLASAIAMAESGGNPRARNPSGAAGLWQILGLPFPGNPYDPLTNARMAVSKYHGAGNTFRPWVAYTSGSYLRFMGGGGVIEEPVFGLGASGRQYMIGESGPETVLPGRHPMRGTEARLDSLADVVAALPDMIGSAVADALDGVSRRGAYRSAYSAR